MRVKPKGFLTKNNKTVASFSVLALSLVLLTGCSSKENAGEVKLLQIDNTKATKIVSMGTLNDKQVATVKKLSETKPKDDVVVADNGSEAPQKQVEEVVNAINTGDNDKVKTALQKAPDVKQVLNTTVTETSSSSVEDTKVNIAENYANKKATAKDIQDEAQGAKLDSDKAQKVADAHNLANAIQLSAQKMFPKDVVVLSSKQKDGTYILSNYTTGVDYVLNVNDNGDITSKKERQ